MPKPGPFTFRGRAATTADISPVRRITALSFVCVALHTANAQTGPAPPCETAAVPTYARVDEEPIVRYWLPSDVSRDWALPPCTGWPADKFSSLVTVAGRFRFRGSADELLARVGAISEMKTIKYWSKGQQQWERFILDAAALKDDDDGHRRRDFTLAELHEGDALHMVQEDNLAGKAVLQFRVLEATDDRIVFNFENLSKMKYVLLTVFPPREMRSVYFLDRESPDVWRFYTMLITGPRASRFAVSSAASAINRAVAFYRHYAGIPTDKEPPAAPKK